MNVVFAGAMILLYLGPYIDPKQLWLFTLLGMGYPYLLLINLGFVLLWLFFWKKYTLLSLCIVLLGIAHVDRFYGIDFSKDVAEESSDLKILSFNTQDFRGVDLKGDAFDQVIKELQKQDVVLLQELSNQQTQHVSRYLIDHQIFKPEGLSLSILSRFPIVNRGIVSRENASNGSIWVELDIYGQLVRIYNVHLQSYRVKKATTEIIDNADLGNEKTWTEVRAILSKIRDMSKRRSDQVKNINYHREDTTLPIIVGGDFNDTPVSNTYRRLSRGMTDSFCAKGKGVGTTYAGRIPLLRIDYIFAGTEFKVISHDVIESSISDHYPIKSVIRLQPD